MKIAVRATVAGMMTDEQAAISVAGSEAVSDDRAPPMTIDTMTAMRTGTKAMAIIIDMTTRAPTNGQYCPSLSATQASRRNSLVKFFGRASLFVIAAVVDRPVVMRPLDRLGAQRRDGELRQLERKLGRIESLAEHDRVGDDEFVEATLGHEALDALRGQREVGDERVNGLRAVLAAHLRRGGEGSAGRGHVVDHDDVAAVDVADDAERVNGFAACALLGDDGESAAELAAVAVGVLRPARVRRDDDRLRPVLVADVLEDDRLRLEVVERNVEEALNLVGVQVERHDAVRAGRFEKVRDESRGNRNARLVLAVLAGVAVIGDDGRDAVGASALERVDDDEELHVRLVRERRAGLDHIHVLAPDAVNHLAERLAVGKMRNLDFVEGFAQVFGYFLGKRQIGRTGKYHEFVFHRVILIAEGKI